MPRQDPVTLRRRGVEYIHWTATGLPASPPAGSVQGSVDAGLTWHDVTVSAGRYAGTSTLRLLVAHPAAVTPDPAAVVATVGTVDLLVRLTDTPEVVIRPGGQLIVEA